MLSDGAIYSSIDFTTKTSYNSSSQITQATPYATTQILHSNSIHELAVDLPDPQWKSSIQQKNDLMGFGYSLPDQGKGNNGNYSSYFPELYSVSSIHQLGKKKKKKQYMRCCSYLPGLMLMYLACMLNLTQPQNILFCAFSAVIVINPSAFHQARKGIH